MRQTHAVCDKVVDLVAANGYDLPPDFRTLDYLRDCPSESEERMRKSRFTDEQVVTILREADREPVGSVAKKHGGAIYARL